jgi:hypothetical protein
MVFFKTIIESLLSARCDDAHKFARDGWKNNAFPEQDAAYKKRERTIASNTTRRNFSRRAEPAQQQKRVGGPARVCSGQAHHTAIMHIDCMYSRWKNHTVLVLQRDDYNQAKNRRERVKRRWSHDLPGDTNRGDAGCACKGRTKSRDPDLICARPHFSTCLDNLQKAPHGDAL